jgi:hypothetical protein
LIEIISGKAVTVLIDIKDFWYFLRTINLDLEGTTAAHFYTRFACQPMRSWLAGQDAASRNMPTTWATGAWLMNLADGLGWWGS